jgi:hypothetical protein
VGLVRAASSDVTSWNGSAAVIAAAPRTTTATLVATRTLERSVSSGEPTDHDRGAAEREAKGGDRHREHELQPVADGVAVRCSIDVSVVTRSSGEIPSAWASQSCTRRIG